MPTTDRSQDGPELDRLKALVGRLTDDELARPMPDDWTVAAVLAHVAFWDRRAAYLVARWQREQLEPSPSDAVMDSDSINDAAKPQWLALAPRAAANEAIAANAAAKSALDEASPELIEQIARAHPINLARAEHLSEHLDEIEAALGRA
jgi:hypothetical protein